MNRQTHPLRTLVIALALAAAAPLAVAGHHEGDHAKPMQAKADIVDTAVAAGKFNTLAAALTAAGLVDTLKGNGPFTVFAPTDEAFAALPAGTVEDLLKPENRTSWSRSSPITWCRAGSRPGASPGWMKRPPSTATPWTSPPPTAR